MIPIIDGHLDIAHNALSLDRDQTLSVHELRRRDRAANRHEDNSATVSLPDMKQGQVFACVGTIYVRSRSADDPREAVSRSDEDFSSPTQAHAAGWGQLAYYHMLQTLGEMRLILSRDDLSDYWQQRLSPQVQAAAPPGPDIACIVMMEGADPIIAPQHARPWFDAGVRMVSLVHSGTNAYAVGTGEEGPLTDAGRLLLKQFEQLGMIVDTSHLCDQSFYEVLDRFDGRITATHNNCRRFVPGNRHLTDEQIRLIAQREGVIGVVSYNRFLVPDWQRGSSPRDDVSLQHVGDQIDHICQLTGSAHHAAIGSDLDGGFGVESCPSDLDTIADLQKLAPILRQRGYNSDDLNAIFHGNWLRFFTEAMPK